MRECVGSVLGPCGSVHEVDGNSVLRMYDVGTMYFAMWGCVSYDTMIREIGPHAPLYLGPVTRVLAIN